MSDETKQELVRAHEGNRDAVERLVARWEAEVRLYAVKVAPDPDAADDIAQDAFVIAIEQADKFDPSRDFLLWMKGIVRNLARREWRRRAADRVQLVDFQEHVEMLASMPDEGDESFHHRRLEALRSCLERLPEKSRKLLRLVYELGMKYSEIAAEIAASVDAVKKAMSRLRAKLRLCVENALSEGADE